MKWSRQACAVTVLFIGCLLMTAQCRPGARRIDGMNRQDTATAAVGSRSDESKLALKFCTIRDCRTKDEGWNEDCICCETLPGVPCWHTVKECQRNCPLCHPNCG